MSTAAPTTTLPYARPEEDPAHFAPLNCLAVTDEAIQLVDSLLGTIETHELASGSRTNQRLAGQSKLRIAIAGFLGDLLGAIGDSKAEGWTYRSLKAEEYTGEPVSVRTFTALVDSFTALGYLEHSLGKKHWTANGFDRSAAPRATGGRASHFKATPLLADLAARYDITGENADLHFLPPLPECPIILKSSKTGAGRFKVRGIKMSYIETPQVLQLESEMTTLNEFLDGFTIQGAKHRGYWRIFNEGDDVEPYQWNKGGRLYGLKGSYQNEKKLIRSAMLIDGSPVVEIDVSASYLTILHGLERRSFDIDGDPYDVGLDRNVVKMWTVATLGHTKHHVQWPPKLSADYLDEHGCKISDVATIKHVKALMVAKHPLLADWGKVRTSWADLMYAESNAMLGAMNNLMREGKPSLSVHDSLIVRLEDRSAAEEALGRNYQMVCGITPGLKVSPPAPRSFP